MPATKKRINRIYKVALRPTDIDLGDAGIVDEGWYEPTTISLTWDEGAAPAPMSERAIQELTRRAKNLERKFNNTPADRDFDVQVIALLRERLVDA
jgi:hypothetical protein